MGHKRMQGEEDPIGQSEEDPIGQSEKDPIGLAHSEVGQDIKAAFWATVFLLTLILVVLCGVEVSAFQGGPLDWLKFIITVNGDEELGNGDEELGFADGGQGTATYFGGMAVIAALVIPVAIQLHSSMSSLQEVLPRPTGNKIEEIEGNREGESAEKLTGEERTALGLVEGRFHQSLVVNFAASAGIAALYARGTAEALGGLDFWKVIDIYIISALFLFIVWFSFLRETGDLRNYNQVRREFTNDWARYLESEWARFMAYRLLDAQRLAVESEFPRFKKLIGHPSTCAIIVGLSRPSTCAIIVGLIWLGVRAHPLAWGDFFSIFSFIFFIFVFIFSYVMMESILWAIRVCFLSRWLSKGGRGKFQKGLWFWTPAEYRAEAFLGTVLAVSVFLVLLFMGWSASYIPGHDYEGGVISFIGFLIMLSVAIIVFILCNRCVLKGIYSEMAEGARGGSMSRQSPRGGGAVESDYSEADIREIYRKYPLSDLSEKARSLIHYLLLAQKDKHNK